MKIRSLLPAAAALIAFGAAGPVTPRASAQPLWDVVKVNLPYSVTLGNKTIPPGDYMIKQMEGAGDSPILLIYNGTGMKFETSALTIKALDVNTPQKSEITLHHVGDSYYLDKVWVQGKNYGYQIPLPKNVRERETEAAVSVPAQTATTTTDTTTTTASTDTTATNTDTNAAATNTETVPPQTPVEQPAPAPQPVPEPQPAPEPQPQVDTQPATPPPAIDNSADRAVQPTDNTPSMPATSADWLVMLLSGGTLSGAGMMLRSRKR